MPHRLRETEPVSEYSPSFPLSWCDPFTAHASLPSPKELAAQCASVGSTQGALMGPGWRAWLGCKICMLIRISGIPCTLGSTALQAEQGQILRPDAIVAFFLGQARSSTHFFLPRRKTVYGRLGTLCPHPNRRSLTREEKAVSAGG